MNSSDLITFLSNYSFKQTLDIQSYIIITLLMFLVSATALWITTFIKEKSRNFATKSDFEQLKDQLIQNTEATKKIEAHFSEKVWINQQIWLKKQSCYEQIFVLLNKISDYVANEVAEYEHHRDVYSGPQITPYMSDDEQAALESQWERDMAEYEEKSKSPEEKLKRQDAQKTKLESFKHLMELMQIKAVFIDNKVRIEIDNLIRSLSIYNDPREDWDMHFMRMDEDTKKALENIRDICRLELNL